MEKPFSIVKYPALILRKKTKKVLTLTEEHREILKDMVTTMRKNNGIGLAAPQVGLDIQLAVVDAGEGLLKIMNPSIVKKEGLDIMDEGCLSVPSVPVKVKRPKTITVEYTDEWGGINNKTFHGLAAKVLQHEIDHLNGRLILDYLPWYKRIFVKRASC